MNEHTWQTCTDPGAMLGWTSTPIHPDQSRTRLQISNLLDFREAGIVMRDTDEDVSPALACEIIRDVVGNPFKPIQLREACELCNGSGEVEHYSGNGVICCPNGYDDYDQTYFIGCRPSELSEWLTYRDGLIPLLAQAIHDGQVCRECETKIIVGRGEKVWNDNYIRNCSPCSSTGRTDRYDARDMAQLADALEEAGCSEETILLHLRGQEPCAWCEGKPPEKFDVTTREMTEPVFIDGLSCGYCAGTGIRPNQRHWPGCWLIELFLRSKVQ